ncbi:MAG: hypothetical protein JO279_13030 [Verrucomicrobia bacterium]|nr:hypothetical protein [Verrucomicrobiota bacterium]
MLASLPLSEMSLEDKLQAMEAIWGGLKSGTRPHRVQSWHQDRNISGLTVNPDQAN